MPEKKKDPAEGWTHEAGGVWVPPMPSERAPTEPRAHEARCSVATGWGAWVREAWEPEAPACVRCGVAMSLNEGCEWSDFPELNLCHSCALTVLEEMRPNIQRSETGEARSL